MSLALDSVASSIKFAGGMRKLLSSYSGSLIRTVDNLSVSRDFGSLGNDLNRPAIDAINALNMNVVRWYDQSGGAVSAFIFDGGYTIKTSTPVQIGKRLAVKDLHIASATDHFTGEFISSSEGTMYFAGSNLICSTDDAALPYNNGIVIGDGGYISSSLRLNGGVSTDVQYLMEAYAYDTNLANWRKVSVTVDRYRSLRVAIRWIGGEFMLSVNGSDWSSIAFPGVEASNADKFGMNIGGNSILAGVVVLCDEALPLDVIAALDAEDALYWGDAETVASSGGVFRRIGVGGGGVG